MAKRQAAALSSSKDLSKKDKGRNSKAKSNASFSENTPDLSLDFSDEDDESAKKASALAYQVLSKEDSDELLGMSALEMESKLLDVLQLNPTTCLKDAATLDYFVGAVYWAKQKSFSNEQLSGFFTVVHTLLQKIKEDKASLVDVLKEYRKQLVGIGAELTPEIESGGIEFFTVDQAVAITDYLQSTLLQHFKLYEFMFSQNQWEEIVGSDLSVEVPMSAETPFPPPLDEGIPQHVYEEFMSLPTPVVSETSDEAEKGEDEATIDTPVAELPPEAADLFTKLTAEDVKNIVEEVSKELMQSLQVGVENKIRGTENAILARINKIHNVLPDTKEPPNVEESP